ncbi:hypothetical protein A6M23_11920 [Acidithiobacillus thiooxidans]|uniref:Uncharacterized protein n=1 Tax=Acidithiobacillus thiooxidans TaxID=930 RepID=A0A1C2I607_ACITH|nr:hypothetical protein A6M23_11920 [Acidithiobacillus thiooxidans]OCX82277.1 hypothetical protein A6P08_12560 [Acidithiobacillus thiooxidans]
MKWFVLGLQDRMHHLCFVGVKIKAYSKCWRFFEWVDKEPYRKNRKHNNHLPSGLELHRSFCNHKTIGMHPLASFLFLGARI